MQKHQIIRSREDIRRKRQKLGLSASEMSRLLGYSRGYLAAVENGSLPLTERLISAINNMGQHHHVTLQKVRLPYSAETNDKLLYCNRPARLCACGCGMAFIPSSSRHVFLNRNHARRYRRKKSKTN